MISLIHFPHDQQFAVRLRFLSKANPETVEITHDPINDLPRKWVFHWRDGGSLPVHCEVKFYGPDGSITIDLIFQPGPLVITVDKAGLTIMGQS